jgi:hypothetical protein
VALTATSSCDESLAHLPLVSRLKRETRTRRVDGSLPWCPCALDSTARPASIGPRRLVSFALRCLGFALTTTALFGGCTSTEPDEPNCPSATVEPLFHATAEESYLGLAVEEVRAIVPIVDGPDAGGPFCTGAVIGPGWVLTAAHCLQIDPAEVILSPNEMPPLVVRVVGRVAHPSLDVALMKVELSSAEMAAAGIAPLGVASAERFEFAPGIVVELAGFGMTEEGDTRELRFLAEPIVTVEAETVVVDGLGSNGACQGDSGGPLLARAPDGAALTIGVLTSGAASCVDKDRYVRLDAVSDWIEETTGSLVLADRTCGGITEEGRCLYGSALYCEGETLRAAACAGQTSCGWDENQAGFRCVRTAEDPCRGVDSVGTCRDNIALSCSGGVLDALSCDCGRTCRIDGKTGRPRCVN